ncbi:MAG: 50S ribosomal protein L4 [Saprospiraceae bacterium]|jgi:large subunit ribosomal protein L4|nr:50S ribosomal protein L4 [Saprospiraceae bacterium]HRD80877.1 50S ribosomal protein L4 [Saprospiraceae bacterium]HRF40613.1 50S ribosomal protein L4 [Saprospiraceae bacterium]HRJ15686.1 50S ribosomal protein L4 [Saprospiraceae bacterium]HRK83209.1 50S ribosomal protein L4 [Saprospiraceae bacterium]
MKIEVLNIEGQQTGRSVELPDDIFGIEPNEHVVYLAVKQYLANQRQGTHKAKERSEMSGSTRKLHRQKGTGGSRKGDINNPLYHGGARVFGPRPRDYSQKLNKKVKRLARKSALSSKAANGQIFVVEDFTFETPKTKSFKTMLGKLSVADRKTLLVTADHDAALYLSGRNLQETAVVRAADLNTYEILKAQTLILAEGALDKIKQSLA